MCMMGISTEARALMSSIYFDGSIIMYNIIKQKTEQVPLKLSPDRWFSHGGIAHSRAQFHSVVHQFHVSELLGV